jgi:hypothetical protein
MENGPARGAFWFWWYVSQTAFALLWSDLAAEPFFMAGLAFRGVMLLWFLCLALFVCLFISPVPFGLLFAGVAALTGAKVDPSMAFLALRFQVGRWIARRARGREMAACVAFVVVEMTVVPILGWVLFVRALGPYLQNAQSHMAAVTLPEMPAFNRHHQSPGMAFAVYGRGMGWPWQTAGSATTNRPMIRLVFLASLRLVTGSGSSMIISLPASLLPRPSHAIIECRTHSLPWL